MTAEVLEGQMALVYSATDPDTQAILELIDGDPRHRRDREVIIEAIRADALAHGGEVDQNRVRPHLTTVYPRVIGSTYNALAARGVITFLRWTVNEDKKGRNSGRPARVYRWIGGVR